MRHFKLAEVIDPLTGSVKEVNKKLALIKKPVLFYKDKVYYFIVLLPQLVQESKPPLVNSLMLAFM